MDPKLDSFSETFVESASVNVFTVRQECVTMLHLHLNASPHQIKSSNSLPCQTHPHAGPGSLFS